MRQNALALLSFVGILACSSATAEESKKIDLLVFLAQGDGLIGQTVTVTGCQFQGANVRNVLCSAGSRGNVPIDLRTLVDVKDANRALNRCRSYTNDFPVCQGSATGKVIKRGVLVLIDARIDWATPED